MKKQEKQLWKDGYALHGSIHTLSIWTPQMIDTADVGIESFVQIYPQPGRGGTKIKVNPNGLMADCMTMEEFKNNLEYILAGCGIGKSNWRFIRTDFRLDSYDKDHYQTYAKINDYWITILEFAYNLKRSYEGTRPRIKIKFSRSIKSEFFEVEHYDRAFKNLCFGYENDRTKSRFEFRTMPRQWREIYSSNTEGKSNYELLAEDLRSRWGYRFDKAFDHLQDSLVKVNADLLSQYDNGKRTDFIKSFAHSIFCRKQLIDLLKKLDVFDPTSTADSYIKRYKIGVLSKSDLMMARTVIQSEITRFLGNL